MRVSQVLAAVGIMVALFVVALLIGAFHHAGDALGAALVLPLGTLWSRGGRAESVVEYLRLGGGSIHARDRFNVLASREARRAADAEYREALRKVKRAALQGRIHSARRAADVSTLTRKAV